MNYYSQGNVSEKILRNKIIDYLTIHEADVDAQDEKGNTILHKALSNYDRPLVAYLLGKANILIENHRKISVISLLLTNDRYLVFFKEIIFKFHKNIS